MLPKIDLRSVARDGTLLGSPLLRAAEHDMVLDVNTAAAELRRAAATSRETVKNAAQAAAAEGIAEGTRLAIAQIVGEYARVHDSLQASTDNIGKALVNIIVEELELALTPQQTAQVLAKLLLSELPDEAVPKLAIRVSPDVETYFRDWLADNAPTNVVENIQIFANDNIPGKHMVVRADDSLKDYALSRAIVAAAIAAAKKMDLPFDTQFLRQG